MSENAEPAWIAVDWGTSHLRAYAVGAKGEVLTEKQSGDGMNRLKTHEFEPTLIRLIEPWLSNTGKIPVYACGMVGARQGWMEAPYRNVPCPPIMADGLTEVPLQSELFTFHIVPGLKQTNPPDVMRGEETQIAGILGPDKSFSGPICLPGTHSKWVTINKGVLTSFVTHMTGELFALLSEHSILRHSVKSDQVNNAIALEAACDIISVGTFDTSKLFSLRASDLLEQTSQEHLKSRLSGMLIGMELAATRALWDQETVTIIGEPHLTHLYAQILRNYKITVAEVDAKEATLRGLQVVAKGKGF